ncbi:MAG: cytochrome c oxidase subunit II [Candidatus Competibacteraceae bacterium]|nr:cytochrome c oxidase subunit II [Candidatus Competibacteraceae bacterium]
MLANLLARWRLLVQSLAVILASSVWSSSALAEWELNMPVGVTPTSQEIYGLHMLIFWICVIIGIVVFGAMFYSMFHHRKSRGAIPAKFHESTTVELAWTIVPLLILVAVAIPATRTLIAMEQTGDSEITIKATGYQWKWKYDYLEDDIGFFSTLSTPREELYNLAEKNEHYLLEVDNPLVLPVNTKIRLLTTAADVIHAWWVPELGLKRDAIPGFINDNWMIIEKPGTYRGQCAELCGKDHGFMPVVVEALSKEDYAKWVAEQKGETVADASQAAGAAATQTDAVDAAPAQAAADREWAMDELMAKGEQVYGQHCVACHQPNGQGVPPTFPALNGGAITTGPVDAHIDIVMHGKAGTAMAAFGAQLNDEDIAAVITYERNAWDNKVGDMVQPAAIKALR